MDAEKKLELVRKTYAAALAEAVKRFAEAGALEAVTQAKRAEELAQGRAKAAAFGVARPEEAFTRLSEVFDCANWTVRERDGAVEACATRCLLAAFARRLGAPSPCRIYCLNPIEGMVRGLAPDAALEVEQTLYDGASCVARIRRG